jgi:hypothetical protein
MLGRESDMSGRTLGSKESKGPKLETSMELEYGFGLESSEYGKILVYIRHCEIQKLLLASTLQ